MQGSSCLVLMPDFSWPLSFFPLSLLPGRTPIARRYSKAATCPVVAGVRQWVSSTIRSL